MNILTLVEQAYNLMRIRNIRIKLKQSSARYAEIVTRFKPLFIQNKWNMVPLNKLTSLIAAFNNNIQQLGAHGYDSKYLNSISNNSNDIEEKIINLILYCDTIIRLKIKEDEEIIHYAA